LETWFSNIKKKIKKASEKMQRLQKEKRGERGAGERGWGLV